ncbi:MAG: cell wall-binding repeat-containing protein [Desulfosporosinus sp.]|nr:cell wall-binding repeat-containing protein [Desulfosporosinus sp.]
MPQKKKIMVIVLMFMTLAFFSIPTYASTSPLVTRLAGPDRYATAQAIAKQGWTQSDYAVLAYGENFPDALSAVVLAKKYDAPIVLTSGNNLPSVTKQTLTDLKVKNVFIIGGSGVIPASIESELKLMGITPTRIAGQDRYETSLKIAQQISSPSELIVTTGEDYPDALSIASIAGVKQIPIILVPKDSIPDAVKNYISSLNVNKTYVIGDSSIIDDSVCNQFPKPERIVGADKYERNIAINKEFNSDFDSSSTCIATGEGFADALTGAAYAAKIDAPIVLENSISSTATQNYYQQRLANANNIYVFGGTGVVSDSLIQELNSVTQNNSPSSTTTLGSSEIAKLLKPSIVYIEVFDSDGNEIGTASGVIATSDGEIFTNYHVIDGASSAKITLSDGRVLNVTEISGYDPKYDAVVLKVTANNLQPAKFNLSSSAQIGDKIYTLGNPLGLEDTISDGLISTINRVIDGETYIQISAPISPGSSGGALINEQGEVIGITSAGLTDGQNLNFAIPYEDFSTIKDQNLKMSLGSSPDQDPTPASSTIATPVSLNVPQTIEINNSDLHFKAEVTGEQIIRGAQAWTMIKNANEFNDPPKSGYEYLLAKFKFNLLDIDGGKSLDVVGAWDFNLVSQGGKVYHPVVEVEPDPQLDTTLYKGASNDGWAVFLVKSDDTKPMISYGIDYDGTGGIWFKAY